MAGADYYVVVYSPEYLYWPCINVFNLHPQLKWVPNIYSQCVSLFNWLVHVCLGYCMIKLVPKFKDEHNFTGRHLYVCCRWLITRVASFQPTPLGAYVLTQWHQDWRSNDVNDLINTPWWFDLCYLCYSALLRDLKCELVAGNCNYCLAVWPWSHFHPPSKAHTIVEH